MKKKVDHSVIKKFAQGIIEHLGMDSEGEDPSLTDSESRSTSNVANDNEESLKDTAAFPMGKVSNAKTDGSKFSVDSGKKKKDAAMALLASNLASKFNK